MQIQRAGALDVVLVQLATLTDPALLPQAVGTVLGVPEQTGRSPVEALIEVLEPRPVLVVLDNCEHLIVSSAHLVDTLLRACGRLRILATSREPLRVAGEIAYRVPPLSLPPQQARLSAQDVVQSEAGRLFVERACAGVSDFSANDTNAAAIALLCRRLDGIPLALELAAARIAVLTVDEIAERLDDALTLLSTGSRVAPARQQTLRATLDWSDSLLNEAEQRLFQRLSVFAGGWTLDAAEAVCADQTMTGAAFLDALAGLVAKSLVVSELHRTRAYRYRMLEIIRQYGYDKLVLRSQDHKLKQRHAEFFLQLAEQLQPDLLGHAAREALDTTGAIRRRTRRRNPALAGWARPADRDRHVEHAERGNGPPPADRRVGRESGCQCRRLDRSVRAAFAVLELDRVYAERYIPHSAVLPRCDLVVCHAGAGIMLKALSSGLPMLLLPRGADHFDNAEACIWLGAGLRLLPSEVGLQTVSAAARQLLSNSQYSEAASRVRSELLALPTAETAVDQCELLVSSRSTQGPPCPLIRRVREMASRGSARHP